VVEGYRYLFSTINTQAAWYSVAYMIARNGIVYRCQCVWHKDVTYMVKKDAVRCPALSLSYAPVM
jgi:hypothetical protein